jgi:fengycin family lipopeptide synthetase D
MALYAGKELSPLKFQYKDYSEWQNCEDREKATRQQEEYWMKQFEGEIPVLDLPGDYPRQAIQSFEGAVVEFELSIQQTRGLNELAVEEGATFYMLLLAFTSVFLSKISNQEDIVIGTPIAARRHIDLERIVGMFVNTLAVRTYPGGEKTFREFLKEIKERTLRAFDNQEYQFEDLVEKVLVKRDISRNPLFDAVFTLQNSKKQIRTIPGVEIPKLNIKPYNLETQTTKFDINLTCTRTENMLLFAFKYCTKLFKRETIKRFTAYFEKLVVSVIEQPGMKLYLIDIIPEQEKQNILYKFNDTGRKYPKNKTVQQVFVEQVSKNPDNVAVIFHDNKITYKELNRKSNQLAELLREKGVKPEMIVGVLLNRSLEMIISILAVLKSGGAYLPIDTQYPEQRVRYMLTDSSAGILLMESGWNFNVKFGGEVILVDDKSMRSPGNSNINAINNPNNIAYIIYTSGSTGKPRGVMIEHASIMNLAFFQKRLFKITAQDRILQFSSISFDASVEQILIGLYSGAALVLIDKNTLLDETAFEEFVSRHFITHLHAVPSFLKTIMIGKPYSLKRVISGGDSCPLALAKKWYKMCDFYNKYGPTETTVTSIELLVENLEESIDRLPIGKTIGNTKIYLLGRLGEPVPFGVSGELYIGGDGVSRGYLNNPELTRQKFKDNPFSEGECFYRTGDVGRWMPDGNIEFLGRMDDQVKIRGFRIEPGEIETQLLTHPGIKESIVTASADETGDKCLCAYIVVEHKAQGPGCTAADLREYLSGSLPDYMIPAYFVFIDNIPLTPNGKIDRKALPSPETKALADGMANAPRNQVEEKLAEIWSNILGKDASHAAQLRERIGIDDNFFQMGGHSLITTIMVSKIHSHFNVRVPLIELFKTPTIQSLAKYITINLTDGEVTPKKDDHVVLLRKGPTKANHIFFIHDGSGEVEGYVEFCQSLEANFDFNFWGIQAEKMKDCAPQNVTIEEIARKYIRKLKSLQPQGPYYIAGWSLGGIIAFEMACQLEQEGESPAFLGLVDSPCPQPENREQTSEFTLESEVNWLLEHLPDNQSREKLKHAENINKAWSVITLHLEERHNSLELIKSLIPYHLARVIPDYHQQGIRQLISYLNQYRTLTTARALYIPSKKIGTMVHYFKALQTPGMFSEGWNFYCSKPIKWIDIPGDHFSIFKKPGVERTAKIFNDALFHHKILK